MESLQGDKESKSIQKTRISQAGQERPGNVAGRVRDIEVNSFADSFFLG
jgi:hypothetical protein